ncbi:MAG TPA: hypothetical protein VFB53_11000 [Burkholderiales bacterium]|nr:hypothetical protein [Burkholderiales bacterium]
MDEAEQQAKRQRLRELLAIPDRQRTDEQWDELNDLEIMFAAGNREGAPMPRQQGMPSQPGGYPRPGGGGGQNRNKQGRKFHHRPPKRNGPPDR